MLRHHENLPLRSTYLFEGSQGTYSYKHKYFSFKFRFTKLNFVYTCDDIMLLIEISCKVFLDVVDDRIVVKKTTTAENMIANE